MIKFDFAGDQTKYAKGGNEGSITYWPQHDKPFMAVTATTSKEYKTLKGAQNFMDRMGYLEVLEETTLEEVAAAEETVEKEPVDDVMEAATKIIGKAVVNDSILTDRKDIAKAMNFGKYPVLTYDLDEEKGGSKARVIKQTSRGPLPYNCQLFMGSQTKNDGVFYLMTKASILKGNVGVCDYIEDAEFANAPVIDNGQEVAILVYSKERSISFVIMAKAGRIDPSYSTATTFNY